MPSSLSTAEALIPWMDRFPEGYQLWETSTLQVLGMYETGEKKTGLSSVKGTISGIQPTDVLVTSSVET
jgi:hypothetical protein